MVIARPDPEEFWTDCHPSVFTPGQKSEYASGVVSPCLGITFLSSLHISGPGLDLKGKDRLQVVSVEIFAVMGYNVMLNKTGEIEK